MSSEVVLDNINKEIPKTRERWGPMPINDALGRFKRLVGLRVAVRSRIFIEENGASLERVLPDIYGDGVPEDAIDTWAERIDFEIKLAQSRYGRQGLTGDEMFEVGVMVERSMGWAVLPSDTISQ